jgi:hypothetical protein
MTRPMELKLWKCSGPEGVGHRRDSGGVLEAQSARLNHNQTAVYRVQYKVKVMHC